MANPTTNFGWVMPTSTSLVTNLPADFNTFGQAVDTSMAQLKGGTTGQILSKTSATDMAFTWITNDVGDITAVTAGTGISGGGTSGAVTITNDMATTITASGDIVVGTGSGTYDNLPIGTTGQVLTADTTVSPYKVKWATPSSGSTFVGASAYDTGTLTVANTTWTRITYNSEAFDTDAIHSTSTNTGRFTIPTGKTGKWLSSMNIQCEGTTSAVNIFIQIYLNGTGIGFTKLVCPGGVGAVNFPFSQVLSLTAGDYIEFYIYHNNGSNRDFYSGTSQAAFGQVSYLGA